MFANPFLQACVISHGVLWQKGYVRCVLLKCLVLFWVELSLHTVLKALRLLYYASSASLSDQALSCLTLRTLSGTWMTICMQGNTSRGLTGLIYGGLLTMLCILVHFNSFLSIHLTFVHLSHINSSNRTIWWQPPLKFRHYFAFNLPKIFTGHTKQDRHWSKIY